MSVSVIIPTLNEKDYISDCLKSLLVGLKDFKEYEILVVDGESEDDTVEIVKDFCKNNEKIKLINNPKKNSSSSIKSGIKIFKI